VNGSRQFSSILKEQVRHLSLVPSSCEKLDRHLPIPLRRVNLNFWTTLSWCRNHCPCMPLVTPLLLQNLHLQMTSNTLSRPYELMVHQTVDVKEFRELFDCSSYISQCPHVIYCHILLQPRKILSGHSTLRMETLCSCFGNTPTRLHRVITQKCVGRSRVGKRRENTGKEPRLRREMKWSPVKRYILYASSL
jgi:hypothetical protein